MALLICFIGLDGAGKSTYAKFVQKLLIKEYGINSQIVWAKFGLTVFSKFQKILKKDRTNSLKPSNPFKFNSNSNFFSFLCCEVLLFEHWIQIFRQVKIPLLKGDSVVCDRYYLDSIVDIVVNFNYQYNTAKFLLKFLPILSKPDLIFYIKVPAEVAYSRKKDIYDVSYLKKRNGIYLMIENDFPVIVLDGEKTKSDLEFQISSYIKSYTAEF